MQTPMSGAVLDPMERVADTNPATGVFDRIRAYCRCRMDVRLRQIRKLLARMPEIVPEKVADALTGWSPDEEGPEDLPGQNVIRQSARAGVLNVPEFDMLHKKYEGLVKGRIRARYPTLDDDEICDDAFQKIASEMRSGEGWPVATQFEKWMWKIVRNCAIDALRRSTPVMILETRTCSSSIAPCLPSNLIRIKLDDDDPLELTLSEPTLEQLQKSIQALQKERRRWKWTFDAVLRTVEGEGTRLQLKFFRLSRFDIEDALSSTPLLHAPYDDSSGLHLEKALAVLKELLPVVRCFLSEFRHLPANQQVILLLCDVWAISLQDAVAILHSGQDCADPRPPYNTVAQWRFAAKRNLAKATGISKEGVDEMLLYLRAAWHDPRVEITRRPR